MNGGIVSVALLRRANIITLGAAGWLSIPLK